MPTFRVFLLIVLLGTLGPMSSSRMDALRDNLRECGDHGPWLRFATSKWSRALNELNEPVQGLGDGVVSVQRGRLTGVDDIVVLPISHAGILNPALSSSRQAYQMIRQRLSIPRAALNGSRSTNPG